MTPLASMLDYWAKANAEREKSAPPSIDKFNHETDEFGFPLCMCAPCRERSKIINAQYVARLFAPILAGPSERRRPDVDHDTEQNGHDDYTVWPKQAGGGL